MEAARRDARRFLPVWESGQPGASKGQTSACQRTLVQRSRVDDNYAELLALTLGLQQNTLHNGRPSICEDRVPVRNLVDGMLLDDLVGEKNPIADEGVNLEQQKSLGLRFEGEDVSSAISKSTMCNDRRAPTTHLLDIHFLVNETDLVLKIPDGCSHGDRERTGADEVRDLRVEMSGRQVSGEVGLGRRGVRGNDLRSWQSSA